MKTLITTLLTLLTLSSCETKYCWKCTVTAQVPGYPQATNTTTTTVCDQTQTEIENYEKAGTMTTTSNGVTVYTTTDCQVSN